MRFFWTTIRRLGRQVAGYLWHWDGYVPIPQDGLARDLFLVRRALDARALTLDQRAVAENRLENVAAYAQGDEPGAARWELGQLKRSLGLT